MTFGDPLEINLVNLPLIGFGESAAQAVEEEAFAEVGQFHRFMQSLLGGHLPQNFNISAAVWGGLGVHGQDCTQICGRRRER